MLYQVVPFEEGELESSCALPQGVQVYPKASFNFSLGLPWTDSTEPGGWVWTCLTSLLGEQVVPGMHIREGAEVFKLNDQNHLQPLPVPPTWAEGG